jgi:hypothetical protein
MHFNLETDEEELNYNVRNHPPFDLREEAAGPSFDAREHEPGESAHSTDDVLPESTQPEETLV